MLVSVELVLQVSALACMPMVDRLIGNAMMIHDNWVLGPPSFK